MNPIFVGEFPRVVPMEGFTWYPNHMAVLIDCYEKERAWLDEDELFTVEFHLMNTEKQ